MPDSKGNKTPQNASSIRVEGRPDSGPQSPIDSEASFQLLVDGVQDYAIFMLDPAGYVMSWNSGAERIKGYREEEIIGQHYSRFYPEEEIAGGIPERQLKIAAGGVAVDE